MRDPITIIQPMTETEARSHVAAINNAAADMGRHLLELKEREGWLVLGYKSWSACLDGEFSYSRKHLYELMAATPVLEKLLPVGNNVSTKAAAALARFDEDLHPAIIKTATARYGQLTESNVNRVGTVVQEMATTGHVDVGSGISTPIDAALDKEDYEAHQRQREYINNHALFTSDSTEWHTPAYITALVKAVLGSIELDPASHANANALVQAERFYTLADDGLTQSWAARTVYLNPPYGDTIPAWINKLADEYEAGAITEALALVPARTDTAWFRRLRDYPRCFINGRIKFISPQGIENSAPFPSAAVYLGGNTAKFASVFRALGDVFVLWQD